MTVSLLPFQSGCHLFLLSCLITVARTSNIILTESDKSGHPSLLSDFKMFQLFIVKYCVSYVFFLYRFFILRYDLFNPFVDSFCHKWILNFVSKCFLCVFWGDYIMFSLSLLIWYITLIHLWLLNSLHLKNKFYLITVYNPFSVLLNLVC